MRLAALLMFPLVVSCAQAIRVPKSNAPPVVGTFEFGLNQRTKLFDFEVPEVKKGMQRSGTAKVSFASDVSAGATRQETPMTFGVLKEGRPFIALECLGVQQGVVVKTGSPVPTDKTLHTYGCTGTDFQLVVEEPKKDVFVGRASFAGLELTLQGTDEMEQGLPQYPSGFHVMKGAQWLGSFEYLQGGKAYLRADLRGAERDAVVLVMVAVQATDRWLAKNSSQNQARPFGM
ncbi:MAG: hypothetical protein AB1938_26970 [Myxococcota bacterium]